MENHPEQHPKELKAISGPSVSRNLKNMVDQDHETTLGFEKVSTEDMRDPKDASSTSGMLIDPITKNLIASLDYMCEGNPSDKNRDVVVNLKTIVNHNDCNVVDGSVMNVNLHHQPNLAIK